MSAIEVRGVRFAGAGIAGDCDQPDGGAENETRVLCKNKMYF